MQSLCRFIQHLLASIAYLDDDQGLRINPVQRRSDAARGYFNGTKNVTKLSISKSRNDVVVHGRFERDLRRWEGVVFVIIVAGIFAGAAQWVGSGGEA